MQGKQQAEGVSPLSGFLAPEIPERLGGRVGKPVVAIIGRQNVGKSTLLNRLAGKRVAIVADLPGTTRDRLFADISWQDVKFSLVDTGGLVSTPGSTMAQQVNWQIDIAIAEADVIVFLVDVRDGLLPDDRDIANKLRRVGKPIILAANKADNASLELAAVEFYQLGLGEPLVISAYQGRHTAELLDRIVSLLPAPSPVEEKSEVMKVAIVGRPNVGKSMLLNSLLGEERVIVDEKPGTTRDAIDTWLDFRGQSVLLIDTSGIRRRGHVAAGVEWYSMVRALRAIERCDVALLVLDASEMVESQDTHIAGYIHQAAKGMVVIVNKWDLVADKNITEWNKCVRSRLKFMAHAPVLYVSAKLGQGIGEIMPRAYQVYQERQKRLAPSTVNEVVQQAVFSHNPPPVSKKQLRVLSATQTGVNPPTFTFLVNDTKLVHFSYQRYLENKLRQAFGFTGTPLRFVFKKGGNYDNR